MMFLSLILSCARDVPKDFKIIQVNKKIKDFPDKQV
jgi:hypothetical protein